MELKAPSIIHTYRTGPDREPEFCFCFFFKWLHAYVCIYTEHFWKLNSGYIWGVDLEKREQGGRGLLLFLLYYSIWFDFYLLFVIGLVFMIKIL